MKLSEQEFQSFSLVFSSVLLYINQKFQIFSKVKSTEDFLGLTSQERFSLHSELYGNIGIIDEFIADNPDKLTQEQLKIASQFKRFVREDFFVERFLSKYAIFIGTKNKVYGVLGLTESLDQIIHKSRLPLNIQATLLPFNGKIIYDGIFTSRNISFGGGIKGDLKETYMAAKQCNRIIETLDHSSSPKSKKKSSNRDWLPVINELKKTVNKLSISADDPAILKPTLSMLKASLLLIEVVANSPDDWDEMNKSLKKITTSLNQVDKIIERAQRFE